MVGAPGGDAEVAALLEGQPAGLAGVEKRQYERLLWLRGVTIWIAEESGSGRRTRKVQVLTHDISQGGFSFAFGQYLNSGTAVCALFDCLPNQPVIGGAIRYCVLLGGTHHRIGVQFTR